MTQDTLWQTKVAARLHDPAEKALTLLRDPAGHENGTSLALARLLGLHRIGEDGIAAKDDGTRYHALFKKSMPADMYRCIQRADWWAAAADRPQWPWEEITVETRRGKRTFKVAPWAQARWTNEPVLIHPLTGERLNLQKLADTEVDDIKQRSFNHFSALLEKLDHNEHTPQDWCKVLLTLWRFGPELQDTSADTKDHSKLGALWGLLPADTRIPDHSIWDHLDLTSAFAGAFAGDTQGEAALLSLSIGPVQSFIASARKTDDLWAGSHLLSRLAWEAMRPICEALGPDAILFPRLRGIPQVDLWLRDQMGLPHALFERCVWQRGGTDSNPLFSAALPNRFVALVPAERAQELAEQSEQSVRSWLEELGESTVVELLTEAGYEGQQETIPTPYEQMKEQLAGFPEVHWAAVPFSLIATRNPQRQTQLDITALSDSMKPFFEGAGAPGFLGSEAWKILQEEVDWGDGTTFFEPNPGVLYPAVFDLAERVMAAAKGQRHFEQTRQEGWRCSLTGETEWLTTDREQLNWTAQQRDREGTLWTALAAQRPAWARKGEHLGALAALKRLWPTLFAREVSKALNRNGQNIQRFVVSTHTMALAAQLDAWLQEDGELDDTAKRLLEKIPEELNTVALPPRLARRHRRKAALRQAGQLPLLLEWYKEHAGEEEVKRASQAVQDTFATVFGQEGSRLETYYGLLMMDGDLMGAILSGDEQTRTAISYRDSFHPTVAHGFGVHASKQPRIHAYGEQARAVSPNRHLAVSGALNDFSQIVARHVVEQEHLGRLIYAGGDDVLAMLPVKDLMSAMLRLRHAYSGELPEGHGDEMDWGELGKRRHDLHLRRGFAYLEKRLMRMMGKNATASCGAVIAHHQAPLTAVMDELRRAEQRAKSEGGRNAFSITVIKRSGGALYFTAKWQEAATLLTDLQHFLARPEVSRRAVYHTLKWLQGNELPPEAHHNGMLERLLAYQLTRQIKTSRDELQREANELASRLAKLAKTERWQADQNWIEQLRNLLSIAEFLARDMRNLATTEACR